LSFIPPTVPSKSTQELEWLNKAVELGSTQAIAIYGRLAASQDQFDLTMAWKDRLISAASQGSIFAIEDLPEDDRDRLLESIKT
jgi:hypothetical protein